MGRPLAAMPFPAREHMIPTTPNMLDRVARVAGVVAIALVVACGSATAKDYGDWDLKRILTKTETATGPQHGVDVVYLDRVLANLAAHAGSYPPKFDNEADKERATRDARLLTTMLDALTKDQSAAPELISRAAAANGFAHNLSIKGAADNAQAQYLRLLALAPDHSRTNHRYGTFLAGTARLKESLPYLDKALATGTIEAAYALGLAHLGLGDKERALAYLEQYRKSAPTDAVVPKMIEAVKSGNVKINHNAK